MTSCDHNNLQVNEINSDGTVGSRVNVLGKHGLSTIEFPLNL